MKEIRGDAKNIRALLGGAKFAIDYYQREYKWATKQVCELIDDLTEKFLESHEAGRERAEIEQYGHYFLGSIIISDKDGRKFIIDGQQRLTSLTLLLIHLYRQLVDEEEKSQLADLIYSRKLGKRSFNLDVEERAACMEALFKGEPFEENGEPESVANILARYQDIEEYFPAELLGETLPYFADWLIENVHLVEITAYSDSDAYTIFETMNDRGLSLTPTDMLKGYLLANITDADQRSDASRVWREQVAALQAVGAEEEADAIKAWLRSQHAETIREHKRGALPRDFDLIGTEFHRWVRDHETDLGLSNSAAFANLIRGDFAFYAKRYAQVRSAGLDLLPGLEVIYYNAQNDFTLQYPMLLAPIRRDDSEEQVRRKWRIVASYIDIFIARRVWNFRAIDYNSVQYGMFQTMREIRGLDASALARALTARLAAEAETLESNPLFHLHGTNRRQIHRLLARMTVFLEERSGRSSRYREYIQRGGKNGYEVEHIWANHPERHSAEFGHPADFEAYRNRLGGLLLLPKSFNASYGDKPYAEKREFYYSQNLLAQSLHDNAYKSDPGFRTFIVESKLPFRAHDEFHKADLDARQELYLALAGLIWDPGRLLREVGL